MSVTSSKAVNFTTCSSVFLVDYEKTFFQLGTIKYCVPHLSIKFNMADGEACYVSPHLSLFAKNNKSMIL